jgi:leucyl aminopeptidase
MALQLSICKDYTACKHRVILVNKATKLNSLGLAKEDEKAAQAFFDDKAGPVWQKVTGEGTTSVVRIDDSKEAFQTLENARKAGHAVNRFLNANKIKEAGVFNAAGGNEICTAFAEGVLLSNYDFLKYKTKEKREKSLAKLLIDQKCADKKALEEIATIAEANFFARDLINEPLSYLTAVQLSKEFQAAGKKAGFKVEVFEKKKIEALKMGGLLSVNKGSVQPPTFTVMEYKPAKAKNKKPLVLVGKGVVYDTGGLSLKPTPGSMDQMKCDMSGAAAVGGIMYAIAKLKLPVHVIALVPATDNRPGGDAYVPGDVITMMNGMNVEMLNADAEGRMILADALTYAQRYKPELVFDFATLTGAAMRALGNVASAYMGTAGDDVKKAVEKSSERVYERLIHFPLWDEYGEWIKSDVADIKNVGGPEAGHITAGKFLEHFTDYPWLHFDIAGTAYNMKEDNYRGKYGSAVCVRMVVDFLKNY